MSKENKTAFIDNVLALYLKDRTWFAILLGTTPKGLNDILSSDKTTYKQLQELLARGGITLQISIQGETAPDKKAPRMQFLKNNLKIHGNPDHAIQKAVHRQTVPQAWWEEDDITISELIALEKAFGFNLVFTISGLGDKEDTVKSRPVKFVRYINTISEKTERKYESMLEIYKKRLAEPEDMGTGTYAVQKGGAKLSMTNIMDEMQAKEKAQADAKNISPAASERKPENRTSENELKKYNIGIDQKQYKTLDKIATSKKTTLKNLLEDILSNPDSFNNIQVRKKSISDKRSRTIDVTDSTINLIEGNVNKKKATKIGLLYGVFSKYINENKQELAQAPKEHVPTDDEITTGWRTLAQEYSDKPNLSRIIEEASIDIHRIDNDKFILECFVYSRKQKAWIESNIIEKLEASLKKALNYEKLAIEITVVIPSAANDPMPTKTSEEKPIQKEELKPMPENKGKQPDSSFDKWLRSLPHNQTNPFYGVLKNLGREDLLRGQYGEETINSVRPFTYPEDEKLIALSLALRKACKEGRISFGQSDEPDYKTRSIIRSNAELCEKYAIMKDVANLLSSTIKKEPLMLDKTTDTEGKDPILCLKAIRTSTEGETKLYATLLKKGFLTTRTADVETTPDLFTLEQWYKVADLAVKHRHRCGEEQILSTIKDSEKTFDEQYKSFGEMMDRLIRGLVFEVSDTQLLNDFACYPEDNKIWHDIRVEKANIIVKEYTDNNERNFDPKDLKLSEKVRLFEAIKDHIKQALKKE